MDNQETKGAAGEEKGCCAKGKCCGGKALAALALVLIGGLGGFAAGRHCGTTCAIGEAAAPQTPAK